MKKYSTVLVVSILLAAGPSPAMAFFNFSFGMNSQGPFFMMGDGNRTMHFNPNHPFGSYRYNYPPYASGRFYNPFNSYNRPPVSPYSQLNQWGQPAFGPSPYARPSFPSPPWNRYYGPNIRSPYGNKMLYGYIPPSGGPFGFSPF